MEIRLTTQVLDICIHAPMSAEQLEAHQDVTYHKVYQQSRLVKIVYEKPNVKAYLHRELKRPNQSTAVTGKSHFAVGCRANLTYSFCRCGAPP